MTGETVETNILTTVFRMHCGAGAVNQTPMLKHFVTADELRRERRWFNSSQMAVHHKCTPEAMRQRLCYYGIARIKPEDPEEMVTRLWGRGTEEDMAEYMRLPLKLLHPIWEKVRNIMRQLTLWPRSEIRAERKPKPKMRMVHRKEERKPGPVWVQLELFNEMRIAA